MLTMGDCDGAAQYVRQRSFPVTAFDLVTMVYFMVETYSTGADPGWGGQRRPCTAGALAPAPTGGGGGGPLGLINIRLRYIASIEYSARFFFFCAIVKKFVEKKLVVESRGGHDPQPPSPSGSAPAATRQFTSIGL